MSEQKLQAKIIKHLESEGFYVVKTVVSNKKGVPDILSCSPGGRFVAIEVKFGKNTTSKLQDYNIELIKNCNGVAFAAWDLATVISAIESENLLCTT